MRNPFIRASIILLCLIGFAVGLFAWGPGHDDVNRMALDRLPDDILSLLSPKDRKAFVKDSKVPDDFTLWTEYESKKGRAIAPKDLADCNLKHIDNC